MEWYKSRIAYLEGVRADLARQLEHERHDRAEEAEQMDLRAQADLREAQLKAHAEREERQHAEHESRQQQRAEHAKLRAECDAARKEAEEATAKTRGLEIKLEFITAERAELLADRDAARSLLASHEGDMDRLEEQLKTLQVNERIGNGLRHAGLILGSKKARHVNTSFRTWHSVVCHQRVSGRVRIGAGCRVSEAVLNAKGRTVQRSAWGKWTTAAAVMRADDSRKMRAAQACAALCGGWATVQLARALRSW